MEIGGGSNPQVPRSAMEGEGNGVTNSSIPNPMEVTESGMMRNPEEYMPIANILRIMRRVLPPQAKVSDDAKETVQECLTEFISFVTGEANVRCHRECRKTITAEDLLAAMATLGFHDYVQPLTMYLNQYRAHNNLRSPAPPQRRFMGGRGGPGEGSSSSSAGHLI